VHTDKQTPEGEKKSDFSVFDSFKKEETPKSAPLFNFQASSALLPLLPPPVYRVSI
jgi:hypothetical protein